MKKYNEGLKIRQTSFDFMIATNPRGQKQKRHVMIDRAM